MAGIVWCESLTVGAEALNAVDVSLQAGSLTAITFDSGIVYFHKYNTENTDAGDGLQTIEPLVGSGAWELQGMRAMNLNFADLGVYVGASQATFDANKKTYAQWLIDKTGYWSWMDISNETAFASATIIGNGGILIGGDAAAIATGFGIASQVLVGDGGILIGGNATVSSGLNLAVAILSGDGGALIGGNTTVVATGLGAGAAAIAGDGGLLIGGDAVVATSVNVASAAITGDGGLLTGGDLAAIATGLGIIGYTMTSNGGALIGGAVASMTTGLGAVGAALVANGGAEIGGDIAVMFAEAVSTATAYTWPFLVSGASAAGTDLLFGPSTSSYSGASGIVLYPKVYGPVTGFYMHTRHFFNMDYWEMHGNGNPKTFQFTVKGTHDAGNVIIKAYRAATHSTYVAAAADLRYYENGVYKSTTVVNATTSTNYSIPFSGGTDVVIKFELLEPFQEGTHDRGDGVMSFTQAELVPGVQIDDVALYVQLIKIEVNGGAGDFAVGTLTTLATTTAGDGVNTTITGTDWTLVTPVSTGGYIVGGTGLLMGNNGSIDTGDATITLPNLPEDGTLVLALRTGNVGNTTLENCTIHLDGTLAFTWPDDGAGRSNTPQLVKIPVTAGTRVLVFDSTSQAGLNSVVLSAILYYPLVP